MERDREAPLNYYASDYNRERTVTPKPQDKTKSNKNKHASLTKNIYKTKSKKNVLKPGLNASYDIWPGNGVELFW